MSARNNVSVVDRIHAAPVRNPVASLALAVILPAAIGPAQAQQSSVAISEQAIIQQELQRQQQVLRSNDAAAQRALDDLSGGFRGRSVDLGNPSGGKIVNGLATARYPTAGALVKLKAGGKVGSWCSGTLIGCGVFMTAGHCVARDPSPGSYKVFLQHGGWRDVSAIVPHPEYVHPRTHADLAIVKLQDTAFGRAATPLRIIPTPLVTSSLAFGTPGTIVGFGRSGGANYDYGLKREGGVRTATCAPTRSDEDLVCWNFESFAAGPGENSNTCNVDSGGPLFVDGGGRIVVAGVTSGGTRSDCMPSDLSYDSNVFTFRNWIIQQAGTDLGQAACGPNAQVTQAGSNIQASQGVLSAGTPELQVNFSISPGHRLVRVALNGTDDDYTQFDYFVRLGGAATPTAYDCAPNTGQYGFCEFDPGSATVVSVLVRRQMKDGNFIVVLTELD